MKLEKVHPELRKLIKRIPPLPLHNRLFVRFVKFIHKFVPDSKALQKVVFEEKTLPDGGSIRVYKPKGESSGAGLLWVHGGGLIIGRAAQNDNVCSAYVEHLNVVVVSVDYRLAPEYPFPAAIDDCYKAWQWFISEANNLGVDPARIAVSGQSAGGGLVASLTQRLVDEGGIQPLAQALIYPMLDDRTAKKHNLDMINHRVWNNKNNRVGWSSYLGESFGASEVSDYSVPARRKNLSNLPPTWIAVGDIDLFYEENCVYAERLREAGVNCQLVIIPMAPHAFDTIAPKALVTQNFRKDNYQFLRVSLNL